MCIYITLSASLKPFGSGSDDKVGNGSEHVSFCLLPLGHPSSFFRKFQRGTRSRWPSTPGSGDFVGFIWGNGICRAEIEFPRPGNEKESDLCHVRDWRPTGSALNLVRDRILQFFDVAPLGNSQFWGFWESMASLWPFEYFGMDSQK